MSKIALNKSALNNEKKQLKIFERYLPALELKRQQLTIELRKAKKALHEVKLKIEKTLSNVKENLPMLSYEKLSLDNLVNIESVEIKSENIVGVKIPKIENIKIKVTQYDFLTTPHWIDNFVEYLKEFLSIKMQLIICEKRYKHLEYATRTTSQRVNLFSKILIPGAKRNIVKINIFLSDQSRAGVVNAKISKGKIESASKANEY